MSAATHPTSIHPTAVVSPGARIGYDCFIGPYCIVGDEVQLGDGVRLESHCVVDGRTSIGAGTQVFPFVSIGLASQDLKYKGEPSETRHRRAQQHPRVCHYSSRHGRRRHAHQNRRRLSDHGPGPHRARLPHRRRRHHGKRGHACRSCRDRRSCEYRRVFRCAPVLSRRQRSLYRRLLGRRKRRAAFCADSRQSREVLRTKHHRHEASRLLARDHRRASSRLSPAAFRKLNTTQAVERIKQEITGSPEVSDLLRFIEESNRGVTK